MSVVYLQDRKHSPVQRSAPINLRYELQTVVRDGKTLVQLVDTRTQQVAMEFEPRVLLDTLKSGEPRSESVLLEILY